MNDGRHGEPAHGGRVSVSALSDRWCERTRSRRQVRSAGFQYPLCRIDGVNTGNAAVVGRFTFVSVSALSDRWCERAPLWARFVLCFVSVSALSDRWCEPQVGLYVEVLEEFQYPLCRIDGVNCAEIHGHGVTTLFQYPLCRIDGVNMTGG